MTQKEFKKIFNMNNVLNSIISFGAYIILFGSMFVLVYLSFVETLKITLDWKVIGVFSGATLLLSWACWNLFYHKQYEKIMADDIKQIEDKKYSVHARYYVAIKDWTDAELQKAIDTFNDEYTNKWLRWVEKITGYPIETHSEVIIDPITKEESVVEIKGIKDLPYKGFKHKILMWRIKNHKYPQSGYKTSMELMSLFSFKDSNLNKRNLRADKNYFRSNSISRLLISALIVMLGASLIPETIDGNYASAIFKLVIAIGSLLSSTLIGAINGVKGGRIKLSLVEDACADLERWGNIKPKLSPYEMAIDDKDDNTEINNNDNTMVENNDNTMVENNVIKKDEPYEVTEDIFNLLKIPKK